MLRIRLSHVLLAVLLVTGLALVPSGWAVAQESVPEPVQEPLQESVPELVPEPVQESVPEPEPAAPQAAADDEIALIESSTGRIKIFDPSQPAGTTPFTWESSDTGWGYIAAGDFNGDGDAELVGIKAGTIKAFDPLQQPGLPLVTFENILSGSYSYILLATGDLDRDGRDEIIATRTRSGGIALDYWNGNDFGTSWSVRSEFFGGAWDTISVGDMNNDGHDDVALTRYISGTENRINVYDGATFAPGVTLRTLAQSPNHAGRWLAIALGNLSNSYPGDEMVLTRDGVDVSDTANVIFYRLSTSGLSNLVDLTPYRYSPSFTSLAAGDVNGDGDAEALLLRNPVTDKTALLLINPTGASMRDFQQSIGYGNNAWNQVRMGDVDADGRDEVVVLRQDRYRIYWQVEQDNSSNDFPGGFRTPPSSAFDRPTMAIANYDGQGIPGTGPLVVSPTSITVVRRAGTPATVRTISITRSGTPTTWEAWEDPDLPGVTLSPTSGGTPGTLNVSISENALSFSQTNIRIRAPSDVSNNEQAVLLTVRVTDKAVFLPLIVR